jgi:SAM-dependent methyltransferase
MSQLAAEQEAYEIQEVWDPDWFSESDHERFRLLASLIPGDCNSMLDVGCGNGMFLDHVTQERSWERICGVDRSQEALAHVRHDKMTADVNSLPFDDNEFDIVSCQEVLEHLPEATFEGAVSEICRVARKAALISVPYNENLRRSQIECPYCQTRFHPDYHMRSFDDKCMSNLLVGQNFQAVDVRKLRPLRVSWHYHLLHREKSRRSQQDFPSFAICPTCHYKNTERISEDLDARRRTNEAAPQTGAVQRLKRLLIPSFESCRWIAGLYCPMDQ